MTDPRISRQARRTAAALTDHFVLDGIELVIVEGTFWTESERDELTSRLTTLVRPVFLTLWVAVEEALRRVLGDTGRRASRNPVFLRASHADFDAVTPSATDAIIDSTSLTVDAVVAAIMAVLEHVSPPDTGLRPLRFWHERTLLPCLHPHQYVSRFPEALYRSASVGLLQVI
jgi:hypothetical protein